MAKYTARTLFVRLLETPPQEREKTLEELLKGVTEEGRQTLFPQVKEFEKQQEELRR